MIKITILFRITFNASTHPSSISCHHVEISLLEFITKLDQPIDLK